MLKKLHEFQREVDKVSISFRFKAIDKFKELDKDNKNPIPVVILCEIMKVSRSGIL